MTDEQNARIGSVVAAHRQSMGLTQGAYAAWLNQQTGYSYDRHRVSKWESGYEQTPEQIRVLIRRSADISRPKTMVTIAVANQKGGVGKTMLSINLAYYLSATLGFRVLLVDSDQQRNASMLAGIDPNILYEREQSKRTLLYALIDECSLPSIILETPFDNLHIVPAGMSLATADSRLAADTKLGNAMLAEQLQKVADVYDFCIVDCPPNLGMVTVSALKASNFLLIPTQTEAHPMIAVHELLATVEAVQRRVNYDLKVLGIVPTMYMARNTQDQQTLASLSKRYGGRFKIFDPIPRSTLYGQGAAYSRPTLNIDPLAPGAAVFKGIADNLIAILNLKETHNAT
ncbi:MAG: AAA family ATPase [Rhodospirillaceae bacterium]